MAIGTPNALASPAANQTSGQTSVALTLGSGISAGDLVVIGFANDGGQPTLVSDGTNTYLQAVAVNRSTWFTSIYYFLYTGAPGATTTTLTIPASAITLARAWNVTGITSVSPLDQTGSGNSISTAAAATGLGANSQASEIVFTSLTSENNGTTANITSWPPTTGYTTLGTVLSNTTRTADAAWAYKIVSGIETSSVADTLAASKAWAMGLATFKGGAASSFVASPILSRIQAVNTAASW